MKSDAHYLLYGSKGAALSDFRVMKVTVRFIINFDKVCTSETQTKLKSQVVPHPFLNSKALSLKIQTSKNKSNHYIAQSMLF